jgi:hypothetical protein
MGWSNAYVFYLPFDFGINFIFSIEDLVEYQKLHYIPNDPFEMPLNFLPNDFIEPSTPFTSTSTQKDNIDVILDEYVVFTRNGEVQQFLVHWVG